MESDALLASSRSRATNTPHQEEESSSRPTSVTSSPPELESLALPLKLKPLLKRLIALDEVEDNQILSILFLVRLGDSFHRCAYATFLTKSFIDELKVRYINMLRFIIFLIGTPRLTFVLFYFSD